MLLAPSATEEYGCVLWIASLPAIDVPHYSLSISLNILLTLMIVIRLALHTRNIRTGMGVPGVGGLYKTIITMLVESSVIYATSSLLVLGWLGTGDGFGSDFLPILAETQVRAFPQTRYLLGQLSKVTTDWTGHRPTTHHSASCQQDCADERGYCPWTCQYVQSEDPRGVGERWWYPSWCGPHEFGGRV